jgi:hypothetical protein
MRYPQLAEMLALMCLTAGPLSAYDQPAEGSLLRNTAGVNDQVAATTEYGIAEETPNQRRARLGQPIAESYQPSEADYGERLETPNERRKRMGRPTPMEEAEGVAMETPNQSRARLSAGFTPLPIPAR